MNRGDEVLHLSPASVSRKRSLPITPPRKKCKTEGKPRLKRSDSAQCLSETKEISSLDGSRHLVTVKAKVIRVENRSASSYRAEIQDSSGITKITVCQPDLIRKCQDQIKENKSYFFHNVRDVKSSETFKRFAHHNCEIFFEAGSKILPTRPPKTTKDVKITSLSKLDEFRGKLVNLQVLVRRKLRKYEWDDISESELYWIVCDQSGKEARLQITKQKVKCDDIHVNDVLELRSVRVKLQNHRLDIALNLGNYNKLGPNTKISRELRNWVDDNKYRIVPIYEDPCTCPLYDDIQSVPKDVMSFRISAVVEEIECDEFLACEDCGIKLEQTECPFCKLPEVKTQKTSYLKFRSDSFDDCPVTYVMNEGEQFEPDTFHHQMVIFAIAPCKCEGFDGFRCMEFKLSEKQEQRKSGQLLPDPQPLPYVLATL